MSIDTAMERLRAANPAPDTRLLREESQDLSTLLSATWQRSTNMQTEQPVKPPRADRPQRNGWLIAAAAFVVVLLVGVAVIALGQQATDDPTDPAPDPTTTSTTTTIASVDNSSLAEEVIALWAANDTQGFWDWFAADGTFEGSPAYESPAQNVAGFYMGLHDTVTVSSCTPSPSIPGRVTCKARGVDEVSGPVGAAFEGDWIFDFADGQVVSLVLHGDDISKTLFHDNMGAWILAEHPDIWEAVFVDPNCSPSRIDCIGLWKLSPEAAEAMLGLGAEYRATLDG